MLMKAADETVAAISPMRFTSGYHGSRMTSGFICRNVSKPAPTAIAVAAHAMNRADRAVVAVSSHMPNPNRGRTPSSGQARPGPTSPATNPRATTVYSMHAAPSGARAANHPHLRSTLPSSSSVATAGRGRSAASLGGWPPSNVRHAPTPAPGLLGSGLSWFLDHCRGASGCHDSAPHEGEGIMRKLYTVLAWTIAGAVVVQASAIAFAFGGMLNLVSEGGVVDKALLESFQAAGGRRARVHDPRDRRRRRHPLARGGVAGRLVLRADARGQALGGDHAGARGAAGDARVLDHGCPVPRPHPRRERARGRRRRGRRRAPGPTRRDATSPPRRRRPMPSRRDLLRCAVVGVAVTTALGAGALAWSSTLLGEYSVMDMGGGHSGAGDARARRPRGARRRRGRARPRHPEPAARPARST